jgi:Ras-related protein Rab-1A
MRLNSKIAFIGLDYISTRYESPEGKSIDVKIWDTAGQERFKTITYSFYKRAQGVLI